MLRISIYAAVKLKSSCSHSVIYVVLYFFSHFQRAADANNAEGLYNMAVFYDHGYASIKINRTKSLELFLASAHHPTRPFPMAMEVVGNHHMGYNDIVSMIHSIAFLLGTCNRTVICLSFVFLVACGC